MGIEVPVISACELVPDRAGLIRHNYPSTKVFSRGIWQLKSDIIKHSKKEKNRFQSMAFRDVASVSRNVLKRICRKNQCFHRCRETPCYGRAKPFGDSDVEIVEELRILSWFILEKKTNGKHRHQQRTWRARKHPRYARAIIHPLGIPSDRPSQSRDLGVPHHRQRLITIGTNLPNILEEVQPGPIFSPNPTRLHPSLTHGNSTEKSSSHT